MPNGLKTALLLGLLSGLLLVIGQLLGGQNGMLIGFIFAVVMNFGSYWFSDKIVLRMYRAQEVGPGHRLYDLVALLAQRAGLPQPKVYIIPDPSPNAFATGRNPEHAALLDVLAPHSYICVPMAARGHVLGALSLVFSDSGREYVEADMNAAQEIATDGMLWIRASITCGSARRAAFSRCRPTRASK